MTCHDVGLGIVELLQYHIVTDEGIQFVTYDLLRHEAGYGGIVKYHTMADRE